MSPALTALCAVLELDGRLFERVFTDLDSVGARREVVAGANPVLWIAGHVASARYGMASLLGDPAPSPWGALFAKGAVLDAAGLPEPEEILTRWREISPVLLARLATVAGERLAAPSPRSFPSSDPTILGALTFLTYHEGYHLGQIALLRKALGVSRLVDA